VSGDSHLRPLRVYSDVWRGPPLTPFCCTMALRAARRLQLLGVLRAPPAYLTPYKDPREPN